MPGSSTTPGHMGTRAFAPIRVAFHNADGVGSRDSTLSRLIGWPMHSPADASPTPSREPAHGSGPMRFATPSSWRRDRGTARATLGKGLAVSAFPLYVPV